MKKKTILVTGANGFLGKVVIRNLLNKGYRVIAMVRPNALAAFHPHDNLTILWADILNYETYVNKVADVEVIVHLAANKYDPKLSFLVNIEGARNIIRLINEKRVKHNRIINISSQSTKHKWKGVYGKSKLEADKLIQSSKATWTTIMPNLIYGYEKGSLFYTIVNYVKKLPFIPLIGDGKWELYPVTTEDVAETIVATIENDISIGKIYELGSLKKITFDDFILLIQKELKIKKPIIHIPFIFGLFMAYIMTKIIKNFPISVDNILGSNQNVSNDSTPTIKDLNISLTPIHEGVKNQLQTKPSLDTKDEKIKIAMVGLGKMGILHSTILNTIQKVEITALIDKDKGLLNTAKTMGINANFYTDLKDAIQKETIQAVYICTPTFSHKSVIDTCLKFKIPYFVEKPVFNVFNDYQDILSKKNAAINHRSNSGYFWIYRREIQYTKSLLDKKVIGDVKSYQVNLRHSDVFGQKKGWQFVKKLSGGGVLANPGPHAFSLIQYFFGKGQVRSSKLTYLYDNDVEDEAKVKLEHQKNINGDLNSSWSVKGYPVLTIDFEIKGDRGSIIYKDNKLIVKKDNRVEVNLPYYQIPRERSVYNLNPRSGGDAYYIEDMLFVDNLLETNKKNINNLEFAHDVEYMIHQSYEKAA